MLVGEWCWANTNNMEPRFSSNNRKKELLLPGPENGSELRSWVFSLKSQQQKQMSKPSFWVSGPCRWYPWPLTSTQTPQNSVSPPLQWEKKHEYTPWRQQGNVLVPIKVLPGFHKSIAVIPLASAEIVAPAGETDTLNILLSSQAKLTSQCKASPCHQYLDWHLFIA